MHDAPNMFDSRTVQRMANDNNFPDLVIFIEENREAYCDFILHGKASDQDKKLMTNQT
jgi:hypothetical protein